MKLKLCYGSSYQHDASRVVFVALNCAEKLLVFDKYRAFIVISSAGIASLQTHALSQVAVRNMNWVGMCIILFKTADNYVLVKALL